MAGVFLSIAFSSVAFADSRLRVVDVNAWGYGSSGGPFEMQPINFDFTPAGLGEFGSDTGNFLSFCIEKKEYISSNGLYDVTFSNNAMYNRTGTTDPLDSRTAYLYTNFITGLLDDKLDTYSATYDFTYCNPDGGTDTDGAALQNAFWYIENEIFAVNGLAAELVAMADAAVASGGEWEGAGLGSVKVINMWKVGHAGEAAYARQDQLVMESHATVVPVPAAVYSGIVMLGGLGAFRTWRRRSIG